MLSPDETKFIEFLNHYNEFYWPSHRIAESSNGVSILPMGEGKNEFRMYALDEICHSCSIFKEGGVWFTPRTTDGIWYKKEGNNFFIFLIEFKGDLLFKTSSKCRMVEAIESLKNKNYNDELTREITSLDKTLTKFSDNLLNSLAAKPLETVTVALPLIYEDYYSKNDVEYLDIRKFLASSRIIYRVVSISKDYEPNRQRSRARSYRSSNMIPSVCRKLARERRDHELESSYESSLQTYHRRYERAGIVYSAGFVDNVAFNNFIENYLK
jgi:hypothetical protein